MTKSAARHPIAVETLQGALGSDAAAFFKDLGERIIAVYMVRRFIEFLMQRVSVAIQRGNAACILEAMPTASYLDDHYVV